MNAKYTKHTSVAKGDLALIAVLCDDSSATLTMEESIKLASWHPPDRFWEEEPEEDEDED